jgi:bifunctional non-homologous end joining protein LigD
MSEPIKRIQFESFKSEKAEGVVFKLGTASYQSGRPSSGGTQLKCKFYASASFVVQSINKGKRSVALSLFQEGSPIPVGNVTIPPNANLPKPGEVIDVRFLYAFPESHAVYQPIFLGLRTDVRPEECLVSQLKFRPSEEQ